MATGTRGKRIGRCYQLVGELLSGKELDRRAIAQLLGVNVAAADKHIDAIVEHVNGTRQRKQKHHRTIRIDLDAAAAPPSRSMAVAACFGASLTPLFRGSDYAPLLNQALEHVLGRVRKQAEFKEARRKFVFVSRGGEIALPDQQGILDDLIEAILQQERVALKYEKFNGTIEAVEIAPWSIVIYNHQIYVIAEGTADAPKVYRFARIHSASRRTTKTFKYPTTATYDPEVVFRDTFGIWIRGDGPVEEVVLRFDPQWRTYVRTHRWHPSQKVDGEGKDLIVRMRVRTCPELEAFILGLGADVEVLAPAALRLRVAEGAKALTKVYRAPRASARPAPRSRSQKAAKR